MKHEHAEARRSLGGEGEEAEHQTDGVAQEGQDAESSQTRPVHRGVEQVPAGGHLVHWRLALVGVEAFSENCSTAQLVAVSVHCLQVTQPLHYPRIDLRKRAASHVQHTQLPHWLQTSTSQALRVAVRKVQKVKIRKQASHRLTHCGHSHIGEIQQTQAGQGLHLAGAVHGEDERVEGEEEHPEVGGLAQQAERDGSQLVLAQVQDDYVG